MNSQNNTVTLRVISHPDKKGNVTFWCEYEARGVLEGKRKTQYHGNLKWHETFWREKRGREVIVIPFSPIKIKRKERIL